jgi:hypothetical protein
MAGEWIKMRTNLWDDPRISRICDLTGASEAAVVGSLYWLWASADDHTEDGFMPGLSINGIDRKTGLKGFGAALIELGWISDTEGGITIERFGDHNGASAKSRAVTAKRVANHRNGNADVTQAALQDDDATVTGALAREEKRREELKPTTPDGVVAASIAGTDLAGRALDEKTDCPHKEIIALYHEVLPMCPRIRDWTPARAVQLRARWNEDKRRQSLDYWRKLFEYIATCDFLVGKTDKPFFADLEWITKSKNFAKIREGRYESRQVV